MAEVSAEARIQVPAEKVWATLTDWSAYGEWNATHTSFPRGGPETLEVGATFQEDMKLMGFPAEVEWTVEELDPARVLAIRGKGPMAVTVATRYTLTPCAGTGTGTGTEATAVRIDGEFTGAAVSLMAGRLKDSATAALNESLRRLGGLVA
ncbi:SRPBCC family protein [Streptomyces sp. NPDC051315]|uniref:type II toxin-antitoxin system Rv0910 family toxin n=1 Tax=Streptomyces sp. NPDC051315 TaxID=3365650 RepID=UPI003795C591